MNTSTYSKLFAAALTLQMSMGCDSDSSNSSDSPNETDGTDADPTDDTDEPNSSTDSEQTGDPGPLFPHAVGNWWRYDYKYEDGILSEGCSAGEWRAELLDMSIVDGEETYTYLNPCANELGQQEYSLRFDGDRVLLAGYDEPYLMLNEPVTDGFEWETVLNTAEYTYRWESIDTMKVPAGTFNDCWKRVDVKTEQYLTYCRGIGRVSGGREGVLTADLIDYHLEPEE